MNEWVNSLKPTIVHVFIISNTNIANKMKPENPQWSAINDLTCARGRVVTPLLAVTRDELGSVPLESHRALKFVHSAAERLRDLHVGQVTDGRAASGYRQTTNISRQMGWQPRATDRQQTADWWAGSLGLQTDNKH